MADSFAYYPANEGDGISRLFTADPMPAREVLLQATIRFCRVPSVVGQAEVAAQAAITAADCLTSNLVTKQQLLLRRIKKSFSKKKKAAIRAENAKLQAQDGIVLSQSIAPGTTQAHQGPAVALTVGKVVTPHTPIPGMGAYARVADTEGNVIGLYESQR